MNTLQKYINPSQYKLLTELSTTSEEAQYYKEMLKELETLISTIPQLYGQDGNNNPTVYLHYFNSYSDFYITEVTDNRAFGQVDIGHGAELGYVYLPELLENNLELDLYFTPQPLKQIA